MVSRVSKSGVIVLSVLGILMAPLFTLAPDANAGWGQAFEENTCATYSVHS